MTDCSEDEIDVLPRKLSFISSTIEDQLATGVQLIIDYHPSSSITSQPINTDDVNLTVFSIRKTYKNLLVISLALILMLTAYNSILTLQSSLNAKLNIGVNSLIIIYTGTSFSAIFVTNSVLDIFGLKWSITLGVIAYVLFMLANIRPLPVLMYISAALVGLAAAPFWTAQLLYINRLGRYYAQLKCQPVEASVSLFFGIFIGLQGTSLIWGNLISYFVLNQSNIPQKANCGIHFDPRSALSTNQTDTVSETTRYVLCGIFAAMSILCMVVLVLILDQLRLAKPQSIRQSMRKSMEVVTSIVKCQHIDQIFLIPITMWVLVESAFLTAQFTRGFITCLIGIRYIGLVMISHGICFVISSYVFGWLARYIGRIGCFTTAAMLNYAVIVWMYFWEPNDSQMIVLFIMAGAWGAADAIWQSQLGPTYIVFFSEKDPTAIAKYRLWKSLGSLMTYSYASYLNMRLSLLVLVVFLTVSMLGYGIVELHLRWKNRRKEEYSTLE